jgi:DNA replication protein DnaC
MSNLTSPPIVQALAQATAGDMTLANALLDNDAFWEKQEQLLELERKQKEDERKAEFAKIRDQRWKAVPAEYRVEFDPKRASMPADTVRFCRNWDADSAQGIGLIGDSGAGKTRLLVAILRKLEVPWLFLPATRFADAVRKQYDDDFGIANRAYETLRDARHVRVLLLDDMGMENATNAVTEELAGLIEHRVHRRLPILWSSNRSAIDLAAHYGARGKAIVRRLAEFSWTP